MGKIGKEKLLKDCKCLTDGYNFTYCMNQCKKYRGGENFQECITRVIKYFPEEPEIDFDALYSEYNDLKTVYDKKPTPHGFREFLKSKNLTTQKPKQIQVKKFWTLKQQYIDYVNKEFKHVELQTMYVTEPKHPEFYDLHEEPDYSKIPKGSIVEFIYNHHKKLGYVEIVSEDGIYVNCVKIQPSDIVRIVELAKE